MAKNYKLDEIIMSSNISLLKTNEEIIEKERKKRIDIIPNLFNFIGVDTGISLFSPDNITLNSINDYVTLTMARKDYEDLMKRGFIYFDKESIRTVLVPTLFLNQESNLIKKEIIIDCVLNSCKNGVINIHTLKDLFAAIEKLLDCKFENQEEKKAFLSIYDLYYYTFKEDYKKGYISQAKLEACERIIEDLHAESSLIFDAITRKRSK